MICPRCRARFEESSGACPRCGTANTRTKGTFQTSTVLIASSGGDRVYRSVQEVPASLRTRLLKSTNGANSATILIADRRGRHEIARAMRNLPGAAQRRLKRAMQGEVPPAAVQEWLTPARRKAILAVVVAIALVAILVVFTRAW
jgi:predicted amidophosphoribosyltransferase